MVVLSNCMNQDQDIEIEIGIGIIFSLIEATTEGNRSTDYIFEISFYFY